MLHLYAILEAPAPTQAMPTGIGRGSPVFIEACGLACAASATADQPITPEPAQVWRHQAVVEALMDGRPVLPLRFGALAEDVAACRRLLARHHEALRLQLDRVRHRVEFAVRVAGVREPAPDPAPGAAPGAALGPGATYLRALARRERRWPPSTADFPHDGLAAHAADRLLWARAEGQPDLRASFLVAKPWVPDFLADIATLRRRRPDLGITVTGPWPPYSFADPDLAGAAP